MHLNSYLLFKKYALEYVKPGMKVLEIGAVGPTGYHELVNPVKGDWFTLDLAGNKLGKSWDYHYETDKEYSFPIESDSFDAIVSGQVIEHVRDIYRWIEELYRITKPGGYVVIINPVSWPYHEAPVDCWRIFPEGMKTLTTRIGFKMISSNFECLEPGYFGFDEKYTGIANATVPGISIADDNFKMFKINPVKFKVNRFLKHIPLVRAFTSPVQIAYDTITIVQKPQ